jgi:SAM-dependent methyltransferase
VSIRENPRPNQPDRGYEKSAHLYDLFDNKDNLPFFYHYATQAGEILDVGAGTGRIALPLAAEGIHVVCVEPSPAMRAQLQARLDARPELKDRISLIPADAASFRLGRAYPAAFLSGTFDHFLDRAERRASLRNLACHLQPGGILVFDVFLGLMRDSTPQPAGHVTAGDWEYRRFVASRLLPRRRIEVTLLFEIYRAGVLQERIEQRSWAGVTDRAEIHALLAETGFALQREFSDYRFTPYRQDDPLLIIQALRHPTPN